MKYQPSYHLEQEAGIEPSDPADGVLVVDEPLHGFILKLNRAEEHFRVVRSSIHAFATSDFYDIASDLDYKGRLIGRVSRLERPEPDLSRCRAGSSGTCRAYTVATRRRDKDLRVRRSSALGAPLRRAVPPDPPTAYRSEFVRRHNEPEPVRATTQTTIDRHETTVEDLGERNVLSVVGAAPPHLRRKRPGIAA